MRRSRPTSRARGGTAGASGASLLASLLEARRDAARAIHRARPRLPGAEPDRAARVLLDRLLFLRLAEERGARLLGSETLAGAVGERERGAADRIAAAFERTRPVYQGGLFARQPLDDLELPDRCAFGVARRFASPAFGIRLAAFPGDLLGLAHQQELGLRGGTRGAARPRERPERVRRDGVHYTPPPVVRYLLERSLGRWLWLGPVPSAAERADPGRMAGREWRDLESVERMRLLDPSCGCGAFLVATLDVLLDWHLERARWRPDPSARGLDPLRQGGGGPATAGPAFRSRLVRTHLHGVDLDSRAIEVADMSLRLRILEGCGEPSPDLRLPDLSSNLRCGNALVEPGWLPGIARAGRDPVRAWDPKGATGFAPVLESGGFDFVVGNPPYVFGEFIREGERAICARYELGRAGQPDLYKLFYERTVRDFLGPGGIHGFVAPDALLARDEHADARRWVASHLSLSSISHVGRVFRSAAAGGSRAVGVSSVVVVGRRSEAPNHRGCRLDTWGGDAVTGTRALATGAVESDGSPWGIGAPPGWFGPRGLRRVMEASPWRVASLLAGEGPAGITRGEELGKGSLRRCRAPGVADEGCTPIYAGADVRRHHMMPPTRQAARAHLAKPARYYRGPKVCFVKTGAGPVAAPCDDDLPALQSVYLLHLGPRAGALSAEVLAAVLCSAPVTAYSFFLWTSGKLLHPQFTIDNVRALPVPFLDEAGAGKVAAPVRRLRSLLAREEAAAASHRPGADLTAAEREVDALVCAAFGTRLEDLEEVLGAAFEMLPETQRPRWWRRP